MIDGPWGSGKTHTLNEFIKRHNDTQKIYYLSLFGKSTIAEINDALYKIVHPIIDKAKKVTSVLAKSVTLFSDKLNLSEGLDFILKNKKGMTHDSIIIFDDLERINTHLSFDALLGYFNELLLSKVKIILACDKSKINSNTIDNLSNLQEKVIDRVYEITVTDNQIIDSIFAENKNLLSELIYLLINNNLRNASRINNLYSDIVDHLQDNNQYANWDNYLSREQLLLYCAMVVSEYSQKLMFDEFKFNETRDIDDKKTYEYLQYEYGKKDQRIDRLFKLKMFSEHYSYDYNEMLNYNQHLSSSIINIFYMDDYTELMRIISNFYSFKSNKPFYLCDSDKLKYVSDKMMELSELETQLTSNHYQHIQMIIKINKDFKRKTNLDKIINKFAELSIIDSTSLKIELSFLSDTTASEYNDFLNKVNTKYYEIYEKELRESMLKLFTNDEFKRLEKRIDDLTTDPFFKDQNGKLLDIHFNFLKANNFFLPKLDKSIGTTEWSYSQNITNAMKMVKRGPELKDYFIKLIDSDNENISLTERIQLLIKSIDNLIQKNTIII
jgi:hypothetical protein